MGLLPVDRLGGRSANGSVGAIAGPAPILGTGWCRTLPVDIAEPLHRHYKRRRRAMLPALVVVVATINRGRIEDS
jgi:hypothetical protein